MRRVLNVAAKVFAIRFKTGHGCQGNAEVACEMHGKTAGNAAPGAAEIAMEIAFRIEENDQACRRFLRARTAKGARCLEDMIAYVRTGQVLEIKVADCFGVGCHCNIVKEVNI